MGQNLSCTNSLLALEKGLLPTNSSTSAQPILVDIKRRHAEKTRKQNPKQRNLMIAGLQVRQMNGESIETILQSLPFGSIASFENDCHFVICQRQRKLQMNISSSDDNERNIQIDDVQNQEGLLMGTLKAGQIILTINGKAPSSVDEAIDLLSVPERLLLVVSDDFQVLSQPRYQFTLEKQEGGVVDCNFNSIPSPPSKTISPSLTEKVAIVMTPSKQELHEDEDDETVSTLPCTTPSPLKPRGFEQSGALSHHDRDDEEVVQENYLNKLDTFLDSTMMKLAYVVVDIENVDKTNSNKNIKLTFKKKISNILASSQKELHTLHQENDDLEEPFGIVIQDEDYQQMLKDKEEQIKNLEDKVFEQQSKLELLHTELLGKEEEMGQWRQNGNQYPSSTVLGNVECRMPHVIEA